MAALENSRLKIAWATDNFATLEARIKAFFGSEPLEWFERQRSDGSGSRDVMVRLARPVPAALALLAGDVIHSLRASLDYAVCELAEANGHSDLQGVSFPFGRNEDAYRENAKKALRKVSNEARAYINDLRPFPGGHDRLYALHRLDIRDKHLKLIPIGMSGSTGGYIGMMTNGSMSFAWPKFEMLSEGMRVATFSVDADLKDTHLSVSCDVAFGDIESAAWLPVVTVLEEMAHDVAKVIDQIDQQLFGASPPAPGAR